MERTMTFILEQQAQLTTTVARLSEKVDHNTESISALLAIAEIQATEIRELSGTTRDLRESVQALADRQREAEERGRRTDERLDALINIVERHVGEGRNGRT